MHTILSRVSRVVRVCIVVESVFPTIVGGAKISVKICKNTKKLAFWGLSALKKCHIGLHLSAFKWQFGPLWE